MRVFLCSLLIIGSFSLYAQDRLTIASGSAEVGETVSLPIFFKDASGTPIDTGFDFQGNIDGFSGFELHLFIDESLVTDVSVEIDGLLLQANVFLNSYQYRNGLLSWIVATTDDIPFNLDAGGNGDLIGKLNITPSAAADGIFIQPTNDDEETGFADGQFTETVASGDLSVSVGGVSVGGNVGTPPVIVSFSANPTIVASGELSLLTWEVDDADTVTLSPGIGSVGSNGSISVQPQATTDYTLTASNDSGTVNASARVSVDQPARIISFSAEPSRINLGETSTISWQTENATTVTLNDTPVGLSGSSEFSPQETTTFTLRAQGDVGVAVTDSLIVTVAGSGPSLSFDPSSIVFSEGETESTVKLIGEDGARARWDIEDYPESWLTISPLSGISGSNGSTLQLAARIEDLPPGSGRTGEVFATASSFEPGFLQVQALRDWDSENEFYLVFPGVPAGSAKTADLQWVNTSDVSVDAVVQWFDHSGNQVSRETITSVPVLGSLRHQQSATLSQAGWAVITLTAESATTLKAEGLMTIRSGDGKELAAISAVTSLFDSVYVPHIAADPAFFTEGYVVNINPAERPLVFDAVGRPQVTVAQSEPGGLTHFDFRQLLNGEFPPSGWGELNFQSASVGMAGVEIFGRTEGTGLRQSVGVGLGGTSSQTLYFPHIAADTQTFWTGIVVINVGNALSNVSFQAYNGDGALLGGGFEEFLQPGQKRVFLVDRNSQPFGEGAAWLKVSAGQNLVGYELFGTYDDRFAGFESVSRLTDQLIVVHLEETITEGGWTGLALINPNENEVQLTLSLLDQNGENRETQNLTLSAREKFVGLVTTIFTNDIQEGDRIVILSTDMIAGFELFGFGQETMGSVLLSP